MRYFFGGDYFVCFCLFILSVSAQFTPTQPDKTLKYLENIPLLGVILVRSQLLSKVLRH